MTHRILVCGATGFVGRHLMARLSEAGADVVGATRRPNEAAQRFPDWKWVYADVEDSASLRSAMEGVTTVVYLVHHMRAGQRDLLAHERASAKRVLAAAEANSVHRIVYLGGPEPVATPSVHLQARLVTGKILRSGSVSTIELRAGMIIGAESESWLIVRDLAHRLPVMVLPSWLQSSSQPIGINDVLFALAHAIDHTVEGSHVFDLPGPETLTAQEILVRVAHIAGLRPIMIPVPVLTPGLSSHWLRFVTRANFKIAKKLVKGLTSDVVAQGQSYWTYLDADPTPLDQAIRKALSEETPAHSRFVRTWEWCVAKINSAPTNCRSAVANEARP